MHPPARLVAIDLDGTLLPGSNKGISRRNVKALRAAQDSGITVVIATGRRMAFAAPLVQDLGLRADMPMITSNGAVVRTLDGEPVSRCQLETRVARGLCGLLRPYGALVFTFDKRGRGELVIEDIEQANRRMALWVEANIDAIEVVGPLESALGDDADGNGPIQGMVAGGISRMLEAELALKASAWSGECACVRTEYPARDLSILDLLPCGVSKGAALARLAARLGVDRGEVMAIGDNWNDLDMLEWAGQAVVMGNACRELRTLAKTNGWKQAPSNDHNGVAVILEAAIARLSAAGVAAGDSRFKWGRA
ncbi:MAG: HAD-IIB family hydrolase [Terracidiphilus sp.]